MKSVNACYYVIFLIAISRAVSSDKSDCLSLGFNSDVLMCNTCETMKKVTGDNDLHEDCMQCCKMPENELYELAVLELDKKMAQRYENIATIMKSASELNLILRHKYMARPTLIMYKDRTDDEPSEVISVVNWNADIFEEYLKSHVLANMESTK
jgi:hypothetical protein